MATTNSRMAQRIDTLANWTTNNPLIQPGETCYIEGSTDYRVNTGNAAVNFSNCQLFKGSDTVASAPGNGTTTLLRYGGTTIGSWSANQGNSDSVTLPNFVANAKVEFPSGIVGDLLKDDWTPNKPLKVQIPNCIPTDFILTVLREYGALLLAHGTANAVDDAKDAINTALTLCNIKS